MYFFAIEINTWDKKHLFSHPTKMHFRQNLDSFKSKKEGKDMDRYNQVLGKSKRYIHVQVAV